MHGIYQHFEGAFVSRNVFNGGYVAILGRTSEEMAVFTTVPEDSDAEAPKTFIVPVSEFEGIVEVGGVMVPRYRKLREDEKISVTWYWLCCPKCSECMIPPGKWISREAIVASKDILIADEYYCYSCRMELPDFNKRPFERYITSTTIEVDPPLVSRYTSDLQGPMVKT